MITSKTATYFESKVRVEKMLEDGTQAKVNELFAVNAMSFSEAEAKINGAISAYTSGEFSILTEAYAKYKEIFFSDNPEEDLFYRVKVDFITIDERSGKERHSKTDYLVQGSSVESARKNVEDVMGGTMIDYKIVSLSECAVVDVIE